MSTHTHTHENTSQVPCSIKRLRALGVLSAFTVTALPPTFGAIAALMQPGSILLVRSKLVFPMAFDTVLSKQWPVHCRMFFHKDDHVGVTATCMDFDCLQLPE
jgi:hypothetical protein